MNKFNVGNKVRVISPIQRGYQGDKKVGDICTVTTDKYAGLNPDFVLLDGAQPNTCDWVFTEHLELVKQNFNLAQIDSRVKQWHRDRNLVDGSTDQAQFVKLMEEAGELAGNIARGKCVKDDIGDMMVVLCNIALRNGTNLRECYETAYHDIKDRKGRMVDGVFVKEE